MSAQNAETGAVKNPNPGRGISHEFDCTHDPCHCEVEVRDEPVQRLILVRTTHDGSTTWNQWSEPMEKVVAAMQQRRFGEYVRTPATVILEVEVVRRAIVRAEVVTEISEQFDGSLAKEEE